MRESNLLLDVLPERDSALLVGRLQPVDLPAAMTIYEAYRPIPHVYFPTSGVISMVSTMDEGTVEVGTIGYEGMVGLPVLLHADSTPTRAFVQVGGRGFRMSAAGLHEAMRESRFLTRLLYRYAQALFDQVAQTAACNRLHTLEERCARWILISRDSVRADLLEIKQQFLAEMLGVHRPAVTVAAGALQRAGLISYRRGRLNVLDPAGLEAASCACYRIAKRSSDRMRTVPVEAD